EHGDKLAEGDKAEIESAIEKCKRVKDTSDNLSEIKASIDELTKASRKIAEQIYAAAQRQEADKRKTETGDKPPGEEVVEAEFEDIDKKKQTDNEK
ncbi:hypothetical protein M1N65_00810, partial [Thermodesulfovibrionales bacterium]|nr:hypothetical protein [Thermodesulfovibrionales bacterium]